MLMNATIGMPSVIVKILSKALGDDEYLSSIKGIMKGAVIAPPSQNAP